MRRLAPLGIALLAGCAGATSSPATEVMLIVDATSSVRVQTDHMQVEISGSTVREGPYGGTVVEAYGPPSAQVGYPRRFGLVPVGGDEKRFFQAHATAFDAHNVVITEAIVRSGYLAHQLLELRIVLDDACRGVTCPADQSCRHGTCQEIFVDPGMLPHGDAGAPDGASPELGVVPDGARVDMTVPTDGPTARDGGPDAVAVDGGPIDGGCTATSCDDHDPCNGTEACIEGACAPGTAPSCDDGVACTTDFCNSSGGGCVSVPSDAACTAMAGGTCDASSGCQYPTCSATWCADDPATCTTASCVGATCNRVGCVTGQTCCAGACVAAGCDDGNACTDDACAAGGCTHVNNANPCSDGRGCTGPDHCAGGACAGGPISCDDGNPCTDNGCDVSGNCAYTNNGAPCNDGDDCTYPDMCSGGMCAAGAPLFCDDANDCTVDLCTSMGGCAHATAPPSTFCEDAFSCSSGMCSGTFCATSGGGCMGFNYCCAGRCQPEGTFCG